MWQGKIAVSLLKMLQFYSKHSIGHIAVIQSASSLEYSEPACHILQFHIDSNHHHDRLGPLLPHGSITTLSFFCYRYDMFADLCFRSFAGEVSDRFLFE